MGRAGRQPWRRGLSGAFLPVKHPYPATCGVPAHLLPEGNTALGLVLSYLKKRLVERTDHTSNLC